MWLVATGLLVLFTVLFVVSTVWRDLSPAFGYLHAVSEAAMVGALADWFAVTALFRHPFGLPIPHTAILPRHKSRVAGSIGRFVAENFLAPQQISARLDRIDAAGFLVRWLRAEGNAGALAAQVRVLLPPLLDMMREDHLRRVLRRSAIAMLETVAAAPLLSKLLYAIGAHRLETRIYNAALRTALDLLENHQQGIRDHIAGSGMSWLPDWVDHKLADLIFGQLQKTLHAAQAPDHPWRDAFSRQIAEWAATLKTDEEVFLRAERIKSIVLRSRALDKALRWLGREVEDWVRLELTRDDGLFAVGLEQALLRFSGWLEAEPRVRRVVNTCVRQIVTEALVPNRAEVGHFVTEVVERWDTRTLIAKIEGQVGKDLQYIRINGTLVGGTVGLVLYIAERLLGG